MKYRPAFPLRREKGRSVGFHVIFLPRPVPPPFSFIRFQTFLTGAWHVLRDFRHRKVHPGLCLELFGVVWDGKGRFFKNSHYTLKVICDIRCTERCCLRKMSLKQRCFLPMRGTEIALDQTNM